VGLSNHTGRAIKAGVILAIGATTLVGFAAPVRATTSVSVVPNVTYYSDPGDVLDEYLPGTTAAQPTPAVIFVHGGAWDTGDKKRWSTFASSLVSSTGWSAFNINYDMKSSTLYTTEPQDVSAAVEWVKANAATLNVDPARIGLVGDSSGGQLSMLAGMTGSGSPSQDGRVRAVVSWSGLSDMPLVTQDAGCYATHCDYTSGRQWLGSVTQHFEGNTVVPSSPNRWTRTSPVTLVDPTDPRTLLFNSRNETINVDQAQRMRSELAEKGVPVTTVVYRGTAHAMDYASKAWPKTVSWLEANL
jgi:acetyl esterase/lipase